MSFRLITLSLPLCLLCVFALSLQSQAKEASFESWLSDFKIQALNKGISQETIDAAFVGVKPIKRIIELDKKQPEGRLTLAQYQKNVVTPARVAQGKRLYKKHRVTLEKVAKQYGVPAHYIVSLWGIETSYGNYTGGFKVVDALATLAYDGRRARFFRSELIDALQILEDGHIAPDKMKGSWAGAMGQCQFMPSSFKAYAVDGNADGKRDIWTSLPDVFASTANYLSKSGWSDDQRWGRHVNIPKNFDRTKISSDITKSLQEWRDAGITTWGGKPIPVVAGMKASLIQPDGADGQAFLVYNNFRVLLKWNRSTYFASSVGILAEKIAS